MNYYLNIVTKSTSLIKHVFLQIVTYHCAPIFGNRNQNNNYAKLTYLQPFCNKTTTRLGIQNVNCDFLISDFQKVYQILTSHGSNK